MPSHVPTNLEHHTVYMSFEFHRTITTHAPRKQVWKRFWFKEPFTIMSSYQFFHFHLTFIVILWILATSNVVLLPKNKRVIIKEPSINGEGHTNYFIFKYFLEGQVGFGQDIWIDATKLRFYKAKKRVVAAEKRRIQVVVTTVP